jgi:diaminopimelate decarboxylase
MTKSFYISGVHSGPNPSPGLGTALALRAAFPSSRIVGIDYSVSSTGLHSPVFDEVIVNASWEHIDRHHYRDFVLGLVSDEQSTWISGLDVEAFWLSRQNLGPRVFVPPPAAFDVISKPSNLVADALEIRCPQSTWLGTEHQPDFEFIREYGWPAWVKGRRYEAYMVHGWQQLFAASSALQATWGPGSLVQRHVEGIEESLAFSARSGRLVGAVGMRKLVTTPEGKTWAGEVQAITGSELESLAAFVSQVGWHGGGEIEMVRRASDGERFLIDVNPRFPAWIYGAVRDGDLNLPAALVDPSTWSAGDGPTRFARTVREIQLREEVPTQLPSVGTASQPGAAGKHPSDMPSLSRILTPSSPPQRAGRALDERFNALLDEALTDVTPLVVVDRSTISEAMRVSLHDFSAHGMQLCYSIKTNPDPNVLQMARDAGWLAEAITGLEVDAALRAGWDASEVILNGPAKAWPNTDLRLPYHSVFFDSSAEFDEFEGRFEQSHTIGIRLRPARTPSRFGFDFSDSRNLKLVGERLACLSGDQSLGVHMHFASSSIGLRRWREEVEATLRLAVALQHLAGRPIETVDLGGGFSPSGLASLASSGIDEIMGSIRSLLPSVNRVLLEPGKSVLAPHAFVVSSVLFADGENAYVDASFAELPDYASLPRPIYFEANGRWHELPQGSGQLFGRSCIEDDIVGRGVNASALNPGQRIAFGNAGAYDQSMKFSFASAGRQAAVL